MVRVPLAVRAASVSANAAVETAGKPGGGPGGDPVEPATGHAALTEASRLHQEGITGWVAELTRWPSIEVAGPFWSAVATGLLTVIAVRLLVEMIVDQQQVGDAVLGHLAGRPVKAGRGNDLAPPSLQQHLHAIEDVGLVVHAQHVKPGQG